MRKCLLFLVIILPLTGGCSFKIDMAPGPVMKVSSRGQQNKRSPKSYVCIRFFAVLNHAGPTQFLTLLSWTSMCVYLRACSSACQALRRRLEPSVSLRSSTARGAIWRTPPAKSTRTGFTNSETRTGRLTAKHWSSMYTF